MTATYPWHRHPDADELFLVLEGELIIEFKDHEAVTLQPYDIFTIPAGIIHRTYESSLTFEKEHKTLHPLASRLRGGVWARAAQGDQTSV